MPDTLMLLDRLECYRDEPSRAFAAASAALSESHQSRYSSILLLRCLTGTSSTSSRLPLWRTTSAHGSAVERHSCKVAAQNLSRQRPSFFCTTASTMTNIHSGCLCGEPHQQPEERSETTSVALLHRVCLNSVHPSSVPPRRQRPTSFWLPLWRTTSAA